MNYKKHIAIVFSVFLCSLTNAQDIHFSQYYNTLTTLSPAFAGIINGDFRISTSYKDQWRSISNPYKTFVASFDLVINKGDERQSYWGIGASFLNDKAGISHMQLSQVSLPIAYHLKVSHNDELSVGITPVFGQNSIKVNELKWGNQFDGNSHNPNIQSGELFTNTSKSFFDLCAGLLWNHYEADKRKIELGASVNHINQPEVSVVNPMKIPLRFNIHGAVEQSVSEKRSLYLVPTFNLVKQSVQTEYLLGVLLKAKIGLDSKYTNLLTSTAIYYGVMYRVKDAIVLLTRVNLNNTLSFGLSYDINTSSLATASKSRGGIEINLLYKNFYSSDPSHKRVQKYIF